MRSGPLQIQTGVTEGWWGAGTVTGLVLCSARAMRSEEKTLCYEMASRMAGGGRTVNKLKGINNKKEAVGGAA